MMHKASLRQRVGVAILCLFVIFGLAHWFVIPCVVSRSYVRVVPDQLDVRLLDQTTRKGTRVYSNSARYSYTVNGMRYSGRRVLPGLCDLISSEVRVEVEAEARDSVVYVDPHRPAIAVMFRGVPDRIAQVVMSVMCVAMIFLCDSAVAIYARVSKATTLSVRWRRFEDTQMIAILFMIVSVVLEQVGVIYPMAVGLCVAGVVALVCLLYLFRAVRKVRALSVV